MYEDLRTAADADRIRDHIEGIFDGWFADVERMTADHWENLYDRIEDRGFDLGTDLGSPVIKRIKSIVRELRKQ